MDSAGGEIEIFCVHDTTRAPTIFTKKTEDEKSRQNLKKSHRELKPTEKELQYACEVLTDDTLQQFVVFARGNLLDTNKDLQINISITSEKESPLKLGELSGSIRCFSWQRSDSKNSVKIPSSGKITLTAAVCGITFAQCTSPSNSQSENTPPVTSEGSPDKAEVMKRINETTPIAEVASSVPIKPQKRRREVQITQTTPKPKSRRQRVAMRALINEKTPPHAQKVPLMVSQKVFDKEDKQSTELLPTIPVRCIDLSARVPKPSNRWGHTLNLITNNQAVLIGGQGDKQQLCRDSIWILDPEIRSWKCLAIEGDNTKPEYRMGHSATYDPTMRCIYVYGGSKTNRWFHDVHMFDLDEKKWTLLKVNGKAPTRSYHSATLYRHELWVFGGVFPKPDPQPDGCDNEVHIFSPVMENWYKPIVTGEKPLPRSGHSATLMNDRLVVFGGWDFPYCYNDLYILDLGTVDWSTPKINGMPPKPRSWHSACSLTHNRIFIHGGYDGDNALHDAHIFDLDSSSWHQLEVDKAPSARAGHACFLVKSDYENQEEDEIIVFGGGDNDGSFFSDMLSFYVPITSTDSV